MQQVQDTFGAKDKVVGQAAMKLHINDSIKSPEFDFHVVCHGPDECDRAEYLNLREKEEMALRGKDFTLALECGEQARALVKEQWSEINHNLVTTAGKTDIIDKYLKGSAYTAAWYLFLKGSGSAAVGDTLASHAGWTEITAYAGNRPAVAWGTTSAGSNTSTANVITMNGNYTVAGAGICTVNTGTSGTLYNESDFGVARSGGSGDTLTITITDSAS